MKILAVPDIHLKTEILDKAEQILSEGKADKCVFLGDYNDEWGCEEDTEKYISVYERITAFDEKHPDTLWCYGNHETCYMWERLQSGFSHKNIELIRHNLLALKCRMGDRLNFIHKIDRVLFSHAGITEQFVMKNVNIRRPDDEIIQILNDIGNSEAGKFAYWNDISPIWYRPDINYAVFKPNKYLQVTGHTPVKNIHKEQRALLMCDTFSLYSDYRPIGDKSMAVIDTTTKEIEICIMQ